MQKLPCKKILTQALQWHGQFQHIALNADDHCQVVSRLNQFNRFFSTVSQLQIMIADHCFVGHSMINFSGTVTHFNLKSFIIARSLSEKTHFVCF